MRNNWIVKVAAAASVLGVAGIAGAQTNGPTGISARLGVFFPTSDPARDLGKSWFGFGADYKLQSVNVQPARGEYASYLSVSGDYYEKGGARAMPIAINYNVRANQLVFSGGVGIDFVRAFGDDSSGFSGQLAATYEFAQSGRTNSTPFFVQAKYFFSSKSDLSGIGVYAGVRF